MDWNFTIRIYNAYNIWKTGLVTTRSDMVREPVCTRSVQIVLDWSWINVCTKQQDCIGVHCACIYCNTIIPALTSLWLPLVAKCSSDSKADSKDFALLVNLGLKHIWTHHIIQFFLAKKPPFAQPMNYLNFGTIAKGNRFNEIEEREVPWFPLCIVC